MATKIRSHQEIVKSLLKKISKLQNQNTDLENKLQALRDDVHEISMALDENKAGLRYNQPTLDYIDQIINRTE